MSLSTYRLNIYNLTYK